MRAPTERAASAAGGTLYGEFIRRLEPASVVEVGSGDPAFLKSLPGGIERP